MQTCLGDKMHHFSFFGVCVETIVLKHMVPSIPIGPLPTVGNIDHVGR
jgi:hypothetical protein